MKNEIILYRPDELAEHIEVRIDEETVWLTQEQMALLFGRERSVITKHIRNIFSEGELSKKVVCAFFAHTTQHGAIKGKTQTINVEYYNLDVIISVGYRVKSKQGTQFRIWANKILKDYLLKGYAINNRMNRLEDNVETLTNKVFVVKRECRTNLKFGRILHSVRNVSLGRKSAHNNPLHSVGMQPISGMHSYGMQKMAETIFYRAIHPYGM